MKNNFWFYIAYYVLMIIITFVTNLVEAKWLTVYLGVIAIFIGIIIQLVESSIKEKIEEYKNSITNIEYLFEDQFYAKIKTLIQKSNTNIDLSHMSIKAPISKNGSIQKSYYDSLKSLSKKSNSHIRRVERFSKEKINWIEKMISDYDGIINFSLYIYIDPSTELKNSEMSSVLSIQRIDDEHLFIVALNEHTSIKAARDIYFHSKELTKYLIDYFQIRIINHSICIIENGKFNEQAWINIKDHNL